MQVSESIIMCWFYLLHLLSHIKIIMGLYGLSNSLPQTLAS